MFVFVSSIRYIVGSASGQRVYSSFRRGGTTKLCMFLIVVWCEDTHELFYICNVHTLVLSIFDYVVDNSFIVTYNISRSTFNFDSSNDAFHVLIGIVKF